MTQTKKYKYKNSLAKKYRRSYRKRINLRSHSKKQKGGFIRHPAIANPLYGALWYSPISYSDLLPK
jgi:hypothetical protein